MAADHRVKSGGPAGFQQGLDKFPVQFTGVCHADFAAEPGFDGACQGIFDHDNNGGPFIHCPFPGYRADLFHPDFDIVLSWHMT
jgi:hypothetical protein